MEKIYQDLKKSFASKSLSGILAGVAFILVALLIFSAGVSVGFRKASFGRAWGEHYNENFGMGMPGGMNYFPNPHGAVGKIIKIENQNIIVEDKDGTEKVITIGSSTKIQRGRMAITISDLKNDDFIITIGAPNESGTIDAKLVRLIPSPESLTQ